MIKNFSARSLGITGRQSELLELALTYAFEGLEIDMRDLYQRSQRTNVEDATKYLSSAKMAYNQKGAPLAWTGFMLDVDMDADEDTFTAQVGSLHPIAELAETIGVRRAYAMIPPATDRLPFNEYFEAQRGRIRQLTEVLSAKKIRLGLGLQAGKDLAADKQFEFVRTVDGFLSLVSDAGPDVGFILNTWDWKVGGGTAQQLDKLTPDNLFAVVISSVPDDVSPGEIGTADRILPTHDSSFDHVSLISQLSSMGYKGPVSPGAAAARYKGQTRESIVKEAQESIDGIFQAAGLEVAALPMDLIEDIPYETSTSIT